MSLKLDVLNMSQLMSIKDWRNKTPESLRTPYLTTIKQQEDFYNNVVCNPNSKLKYWAILKDNGVFVGCCGLEIQWENRLAEISLMIAPEYQKKNLGMEAVDLLLSYGFENLNLDNIFGECYDCNPDGIAFWQKVIEKYGAITAFLPSRKYWSGRYWNSLYFNINHTLGGQDDI